MKNFSLLFLACSTALAGVAHADRVVSIGYSNPLSGGAAAYGKDVQSALEFAVADLNKAGGIKVAGEKVTFRLVSLDDRYLPNETAVNVKRLTSQGVKYIVIGHAGGILTAQPLTTRDPQFLLLAYSSEPRILEANNPLTVMLAPSYDGYAAPFVAAQMNAFGPKLGLVGASSAYGKQWAEAISAEWQNKGGTLGRNNAVDYNTTVDFSAAVTKALSEKPDVLFVGGPSQPTGLVIKAAREQGFKGGFILMDQAKLEQIETVIPRSYLDGSVGAMPVRDVAGTQLFVTRYQNAYKKVPTNDMAFNYLSVNLLAKAMELAGTTDDPVKVRAQFDAAARALSQAKTVYPLTGVASNGRLGTALTLTSVQNGKYVRLRVTDAR